MISKLVSHYRILEKLDRGGMDMVYKAEDLKLRPIVGLGFLPRKLTILSRLHLALGCLLVAPWVVSKAADPVQSHGDSVDLRPAFERWELPLRPQGGRGTCSVFTLVGAIEYAMAHRNGKGEPMSVEFLNWASNRAIGQSADGGFFSDLWTGFTNAGICAERILPYQQRFDPGLQPADEIQNEGRHALAAGLRLHWIKPWNVKTGITEAQFQSIRQVLTNGWPVCGGFRWPKSEHWREGILEMAAPEDVFDGHSVLLVGFRDDARQAGAGVFLIRNTGNGVADAALPYEFVRLYMNDAVWVDHP